MNRWLTGCAAGLMMLAAACTPAPPVAAPVADTRAADEKTIRDGEVAWNSDWAAKDAEKIISHYADDAALLVPNMAAMKGKEAISAGLKEILADPNVALTFTAVSADVSKGGDLAYTQGTYSMTMTDPKTKKAVTEKGKYVTVYKKQADGSWKAVEDINNADPPAPPPAKS